jgi:hypothetical protein
MISTVGTKSSGLVVINPDESIETYGILICDKG